MIFPKFLFLSLVQLSAPPLCATSDVFSVTCVLETKFEGYNSCMDKSAPCAVLEGGM